MKTFRIYLVISYILLVTDGWFRMTDWLSDEINGFGLAMTLFVLYWTAAATCGYLLVRAIQRASVEEKTLAKKRAWNEAVSKTFDKIYEKHPAIMRKEVDLFNDEHKKIGSSTVWGQISDEKRELMK